MGECIKKVFIEMKDKFIDGIPEMHIPVLDPFQINEIDFNTGSGSTIGLESRFSNVLITYNRNVILESVNIDIQNGLCTIEVYFPILRMTSKYRLTGKVMIMQLNGTGHADGNFSKYILVSKQFTNYDVLVVIMLCNIFYNSTLKFSTNECHECNLYLIYFQPIFARLYITTDIL